MKKTLLVLFIFFPFFLFSQESIINNNYENFIKIEPTEVYSSAILIFDFEKAQEITYTLTYNNTIISTAVINNQNYYFYEFIFLFQNLVSKAIN